MKLKERKEMSMVSVTNLSHAYAAQMIFRNVSFRLNRGEHAALVGSNGAGKSTLLRILAGELIPDTGTIEWLPGVRFGYLRQHSELKSGTTILDTLRGAFEHLYELERSLLQTGEKMSTGEGDVESLLIRYGDMQHKLEQSDFYRLDALIEEVANGLGLTELGLKRCVDELSGGQRTKLLLGKLLLEEPELLLLDEPTNFLDDAHIEWLSDYLARYEHAYLIVSHDERFLRKTATTVFHLEQQQLRRYTGDYLSFLSQYEQSRQQAQTAYVRQQAEIDRLESFIQKNRIRKAKQAKSREKMLEKLTRIDRPTVGQRPRFSFLVSTEPVARVMEAKRIQIGYSKPLFAPRDLQINRGDKIAVIGSNGIGKSTMLKTLLGYVTPLNGIVKLGERVLPGYYAQEQDSSDRSPLELLCAYRTDLTQKDIRKTLAMSGLTDKHIRQPLRSLSGGEQAKVRLSKLMLTRCNLLVLDEPTNHLDPPAKEALREALKQYTGTIVLVSHEPSFYAEWVTEVWQVDNWKS
jgi:ATPase subunit of ABC transporter with duplicated ATPase domains